MTSNKFSFLIARIVMAVTLLFGVAPMLSACSDPPKEWPPITIQGDWGQVTTSPADRADHFVRHYTGIAGHAFSVTLYMCVISLMPWVVILVIPGVLFGKLEMKVESLLILGASAMLWFKSDTFQDLGLGWWLLILDVIPATIMLFWSEEHGKILLFALPAVACDLYMVMSTIIWIGDGLVKSPLITLAWIVGKVFVTIFCYKHSI
jgi:hypothetical protein